MSRYIDAEKIEIPLMEMKTDETWMKVAVDSTPTADVRENVRSEWIVRGAQDWKGRPTGEKFIKCDKCRKEEIISMGRGLFNYCPNCGADMRGDKHERK